jgi:hypothetical protein
LFSLLLSSWKLSSSLLFSLVFSSPLSLKHQS